MNAATGEPSGTYGRDERDGQDAQDEQAGRDASDSRDEQEDADDRGDGFTGPTFDGLGFDGMRDRATGLGARPYRAAADAGDGDDGWADDAELSQLVRPYTLTRGRTRHAEGAAFDVIAQIVAVDRTGLPEQEALEGAEGPEYQAILDLVLERPLSVAEVAAGTDLPLGVVRILLGDLMEADLIRVSRPVPTAQLPDTTVLRDVIRGLRAL